jgi:RNA polymerase sigma-32 factor
MRAHEPRVFGNHNLDAAAATRMLSPAEEQQLARAAVGGDESAFERLVAAHLRLVFSIAYTYRRHQLSLDELVSEGLIGLVIACRRFDPERGTRLAPYAAQWIRARLRHYTLSNRRIVRTPSTRAARTLLAQLGATRQRLTQARGEPPDSGMLASALGVTTHDVEEMASSLGARDLPYGVAIADGHAFEASDGGASPEANVLESEERIELAQHAERVLAQLTPRDRHVLEQRCLTDCTLGDLGRELGISRERVRQLERRARAEVRKVATAFESPHSASAAP